MDKKMNKDWTDAVREQFLSDRVAPSPDGWSRIDHKMRRAAAVRRSAMAAAVFVPLATLLLWAPWRQPSVPRLATIGHSSVLADTPASLATPLLPGTVPSIPHRAPTVPEASPVTPAAPAVIPDTPADGTDASPARQDTPPVLSDTPLVGPEEAVFEPFQAPEPQNRPRLSVGLKAGSGAFRRNEAVSLPSSPYVAGLTYLNTYLKIINPTWTQNVKSTASNTSGLGAEANLFFPESSINQYRHNLPLSLGVMVRMDIRPRLGVESGIEYTFLHSAIESVIGRLDQRLHFIGIPVRLDYRFLSRGGLDLYAGVGAKAEKCIAASFGAVNCEEKRIQWSADAFAGVQYRLWDRAHLFIQPEVSYYFTATDLPTYRTENPLSFTLQAGLRFDL